MKVTPIFTKYVVDVKGKILESNEPDPEQVLSPQTSFLITSMMEDVVKYGTGWRAKALGRAVAGKTGTTNDYRDAWFVGYTPNLVACAWVGFDNYSTLGGQETGARAASPIWVSFMSSALSEDSEGFSQPEGIISLFVDPGTGLLSNDNSGIKEYFKDGTQPRQFSPSKTIWDVLDPFQFNFD